MKVDLSDERFHRKRVAWKSLVADGVKPRDVLQAAQRQRLWKLARSAQHRIENFPEESG